MLINPLRIRIAITVINGIFAAKNLSTSCESSESLFEISSHLLILLLLVKSLSVVDKASSFRESLLEFGQLIFLNRVHQTRVTRHWYTKLFLWRLSMESSSVNLIVPVHAKDFVHDFRLLYDKLGLRFSKI